MHAHQVSRAAKDKDTAFSLHVLTDDGPSLSPSSSGVLISRSLSVLVGERMAGTTADCCCRRGGVEGEAATASSPSALSAAVILVRGALQCVMQPVMSSVRHAVVIKGPCSLEATDLGFLTGGGGGAVSSLLPKICSRVSTASCLASRL